MWVAGLRKICTILSLNFLPDLLPGTPARLQQSSGDAQKVQGQPLDRFLSRNESAGPLSPASGPVSATTRFLLKAVQLLQNRRRPDPEGAHAAQEPAVAVRVGPVRRRLLADQHPPGHGTARTVLGSAGRNVG